MRILWHVHQKPYLLGEQADLSAVFARLQTEAETVSTGPSIVFTFIDFEGDIDDRGITPFCMFTWTYRVYLTVV